MKIFTQFVIACLFVQAIHAQGNTWTQKADFSGVTRIGASGFSIAGKGYIGTGFSNYQWLKDFWEYDAVNDVWAQKADFGGVAREGGVGFSINNKGYIGTGENGDEWPFTFNDFWEYDVAANTWIRKADLPGGSRGRYTAVGFTIGSKGYVGLGSYFGVYDPFCWSDFWEYDPATNIWTSKANFGGGRRASAIGFGAVDKGYVGTGTFFEETDNGTIYTRYKDFWQYDPAANLWTSKADFPAGERFGATGFSVAAKGYLSLGYDVVSGTTKKDLWEYDPLVDSWLQRTNFPGTGISRLVALSINDKAYIGLGSNANDFWEYTPGAVTPDVPNITSFTPTSGPVGTTVTITGTNFGADIADNIVFFGATKATVVSVSATSVTVTVPYGATYNPLTVTTNGLIGYSQQPFLVTFEGGRVIDENSFADAINYQMGSNPTHLKLTDLDGDGKSDMIAASYGDPAPRPENSVAVFRNTGQSGIISFAPKTELLKGGGYTNVAIADYDGDGKPDLAVRDSYYEKLYVFRNTSSVGLISFSEKVEYSTRYFPWDICASDVDGDGKTDIVMVNWDSTFSVFRNVSTTGSISFESHVDFNLHLQPLSIAVGDLDNDGKADITIGYVNYNNNTISVFKNKSTSSLLAFDEAIDLPNISDGYTSGISIGDLDGDGQADLAVSNFSNEASTVSLFRNTGSSGVISFAPKISLSTGGSGFQNNAVNDLDGDGKLDITGGNYWSGSVAVLKNQSSSGMLSFAPAVNYIAGSGPYGICAGDLDNDGMPDIAFVNLFSETISVLRNQITSDKCEAPAALKVTKISDTSAILKWALPTGTVSNFKIRYRAAGSNDIMKIKVKGTSNHVVLCGLKPNTTYEWQMRSNCAEDTSVWVCGPNFTTVSATFALAPGVINSFDSKSNNVSIQVAPNPSNGNFTLLMQLPAKEALTILTLYNSLGEKVWQQQAGMLSGAVTKSISLNNRLSAGVYILRIERNDMQLVQKVIVSK